MKFGVVVFPGSNCDHDMIYVLRNILKQNVVELWHKNRDIKGCDFIVLPGGFSYGDYLRCGAIARFSPVMDEVTKHAQRGGYVLGVCNGFQILCEARLVPGALLRNTNGKFICKNIFLKAANNTTLLTQGVPAGKALKIPIAHGEGRFYAEADEIKKLQDNGQILFQYCNEAGVITEAANPNGSLLNIAGVCNAGKNVFGMMPHPERASDPLVKNTDGKLIFESLLSLVNAA